MTRRPRYRKDVGGGAELVWLADEEELTIAARITKADRKQAIEAGRLDGRDGLADLLDAKPMQSKQSNKKTKK